MTKFFDVVDKSDRVIGRASVKECHSNSNLIHRVVHFTLIDKPAQKVLLTKRAFGIKFDARKWCFLGEHVLAGEGYEEALIKGVKNELGFLPKKFKELGDHPFFYDQQTEFARFFMIYWEGEKIKPDPREIVEIKWLDLESLSGEQGSYSKIARCWIKNINWEKILIKDLVKI